ncbi:MAG: AmmeMemoRadiSam system protein B, partial [Ignavibacteria bacterium]
GVSVYNGDAYRTPLGLVAVDKDKSDRLTNGMESIYKSVQGHRHEHALEVHLPFLQYALKDFSLVPVVIGDQNGQLLFELSEKLTEIIDDKTLIVASSDLSHFHSRKEAHSLDSIIEERINSLDYLALLDDLDNNRCEACGGGPIVSVMKAAELMGKNKARVLHRSDSGDVTGDNSEVVGYLSAIIY